MNLFPRGGWWYLRNYDGNDTVDIITAHRSTEERDSVEKQLLLRLSRVKGGLGMNRAGSVCAFCGKVFYTPTGAASCCNKND